MTITDLASNDSWSLSEVLGCSEIVHVCFEEAAALPRSSHWTAIMGLHYLRRFLRLAPTIEQPSLHRMDYIYPINFVGHDDWLESGYDPNLAQGDVVTRDGEFLGMWRVVDCDPKDETSSGRLEFILDGESAVKFAEDFAALDIRNSRGFALYQLTRTIKAWHEEQAS